MSDECGRILLYLGLVTLCTIMLTIATDVTWEVPRTMTHTGHPAENWPPSWTLHWRAAGDSRCAVRDNNDRSSFGTPVRPDMVRRLTHISSLNDIPTGSLKCSSLLQNPRERWHVYALHSTAKRASSMLPNSQLIGIVDRDGVYLKSFQLRCWPPSIRSCFLSLLEVEDLHPNASG